VTATRALLVLLSVLALSACGSSNTTQPTSESQTSAKVTPVIEAIDEPAPPLPADGDAVVRTTWSMCFSDEAKTDDQDECSPTPDEVEHLRQMEVKFEQAVRPAKGTVPRAIAQLRLATRGAKARVRFITWRNEAGKLCVETEEQDEDSVGSGGPSGPCVPGARCTNLCVGRSGSSGSDGVYAYLLSGLVASEADNLRMTLDDGRVEDIALTGPVVPDFPKYRVFMLDLDRDLYRRLELRRGDEVIAEEKVSDAEIRLMRCEDSGPPALPSQGEQRRHVDQCLERAAPK
jgi:hypothetical protein